MAGLFVSSSGTGHVINSSPWSSLVPQLPLYPQFYIKNIPEPTSAPAACPGCIPAPSQRERGLESVSASLQPRVACLGVSPSEQRNRSHHIQCFYPALIPSQDQRSQPEAAGGTKDFSSQSPQPPQHNPFMAQKRRSLEPSVFSLARLPRRFQIPPLASLSRPEIFLGFLFSALRTDYALAGTN